MLQRSCQARLLFFLHAKRTVQWIVLVIALISSKPMSSTWFFRGRRMENGPSAKLPLFASTITAMFFSLWKPIKLLDPYVPPLCQCTLSW